MEFDKSRCYSALNADELRAGDKVITARCMADLKTWVEADAEPNIIELIQDETNTDRFTCKCHGSNKTYDCPLAYLVERAENCTNCVHREGEGCKPNVSPINCCPCYDREVKQSYIEPKAEHKCETCKYKNCVFKYLNTKNECDRWEAEVKTDKHTDYNHCEEAKKTYACAMTNVCPNKHYRPFANTDELIKVWNKKFYLDFKPSHDPLTMPLIWVRRKEANSKGQLITEFGDGWGVGIGRGEAYNMTDLWVHFTFLDGSVCGVEE